jgi:hypothetical protein
MNNLINISIETFLSNILDLPCVVLWAIMYDRLELLDAIRSELLDEKSNYSLSNFVDCAIKFQSLGALIWLHDTGYLVLTNDDINSMLRHSRFDMFQWVYDNAVYRFDSFTFGSIYTQYHDIKIIDILYLLASNELLSTLNTQYIIYTASKYEHFDVLDWLWSRADSIELKYDFTVIDDAFINRYGNNLNWWYDKYLQGYKFEYSERALESAMMFGDMEKIKWWVDHSHEFKLKYNNQIIHTCSLKVLNYIFFEQDVIKLSIPDKVIDYTTSTHLLSFLLDNNMAFEYTTKAMDSAYIHALHWWYNRRHQLELKYTHKAFDALLHIDNTSNALTIDWWYNKRNELEVKVTPKLLIQYVDNNRPLRSYLLELIN